MSAPLYHVGQIIYRTANPFPLERITRVSTDKDGLHWYYTTTEVGVRRIIGLVEHEIRLAQ